VYRNRLAISARSASIHGRVNENRRFLDLISLSAVFEMPQDFKSPFLEVHNSEWIAANDLAFAIYDKFPVSKGHALVISKRLIATWFDASDAEQAGMMSLVGEVRRFLDDRLHPKPDGYNVGFNSGIAAGQTVPHLHVHVIPRYHGDVTDPTGGIRHVIPAKANYLRRLPATTKPRVSTG
jgi:diadenosine tetraphosphate (Ap4A) HIT family hydrolase